MARTELNASCFPHSPVTSKQVLKSELWKSFLILIPQITLLCLISFTSLITHCKSSCLPISTFLMYLLNYCNSLPTNLASFTYLFINDLIIERMNEFQLSLMKQFTPYLEMNSYSKIWDQFISLNA